MPEPAPKMTRWVIVYEGLTAGDLQAIGNGDAWCAGRPTLTTIQEWTEGIRKAERLKSVVITNLIELGDAYDINAEAN